MIKDLGETEGSNRVPGDAKSTGQTIAKTPKPPIANRRRKNPSRSTIRHTKKTSCNFDGCTGCFIYKASKLYEVILCPENHNRRLKKTELIVYWDSEEEEVESRDDRLAHIGASKSTADGAREKTSAEDTDKSPLKPPSRPYH